MNVAIPIPLLILLASACGTTLAPAGQSKPEPAANKPPPSAGIVCAKFEIHADEEVVFSPAILTRLGDEFSIGISGAEEGDHMAWKVRGIFRRMPDTEHRYQAWMSVADHGRVVLAETMNMEEGWPEDMRARHYRVIAVVKEQEDGLRPKCPWATDMRAQLRP